ncbi:MAG: ATP-binding protein [Acidobacteria bacterium]|nr:ATP-binding protein [Acidobacteriota bacterium]
MSEGCGRCERTPGWASVEVAGHTRLRRCGCWTAAHAAPPSVPRELRGARWSTWERTADNRRALAAAREFLAAGADGPDLFLCGAVGTGKTRLACTVLNEAWKSGERSVAFARVPMLLYRLQPHGTGAETAEEFNRLAAAKLLVLDDLGAERDAATDYTRRTLLMLYEARHDAGKRTVWTSNKTPAEVGAFMGDDRLASRIAGRCRVVELAGRDWRLRGPAPAHSPGRAPGIERSAASVRTEGRTR